MPRTNPWKERALAAEQRYDDLLSKYHELVAQRTPRTTATVHAPPPSDEVKAKTRDVEAQIATLAADLAIEHPHLTPDAARTEARRIMRVARGEE